MTTNMNIRTRKISILNIIFVVIVSFMINSIYNSPQNTYKSFMNVEEKSQENSSSDLNYSQERLSVDKEVKLKRHMIVATLESAPFMMKRKRNDNTTEEWYGYCMDLFLELVRHLPYNLTYEIYQVSDNKFGSKSKHLIEETVYLAKENRTVKSYKTIEKWNGLIGDLHKGKAHLALAPLAVMAERELAVDFTVPFYDSVGIQILLKKPEVPQDWFKFLTVLDGEVWFSVTVFYFVTSFVMFLFDRLSPYSHKNLSRISKLKERQKASQFINENLLSQDQTNSKSVAAISKSINKNHDTNNFVDDINRGSDRALARSDQLFIGSLGQYPINEKRSSILLFNGFDFTLNKRRGSIFPTNESNIVTSPGHDKQRSSRGSKTFSDYFRSLEFGKRTSSWESDEDESSDTDDGKPDFSLRDSLWFCITSLTPQGGGEAPQNLSGRVVAGAWWLFCFIIIASYTANLAAFLTVSRLDIPIESLDDLVKQYRIKYAPVDGTAEQTYFERMAYIEEIFYKIWKDMSLNDSLTEEERLRFAVWDYPISDKYTKIWAQIQQVGMPANADDGIKRVKSSNLDDGFALLADANTVKHAVMTDCSFKAVADEFSRKPIALGVRKGDDELRDDLSYAILQLINQRYMEILREKWWTNNPSRVICDNKDESEGISIENIGGVFIIIFAGVTLSFFVWAVERFIYRTRIGVSQHLIERS